MPKTKISEFSATPANNTDIDSINIAEGCAPSGINDAIRELMAQLKDFQTGAVGDSFNGPIGTSTAAAGAFTTLAASGAVTLSGGTANGVTYLNGSKVLTSGSALTFDGTNLGIGNSLSGIGGYVVVNAGGTGSSGLFRVNYNGTNVGQFYTDSSSNLYVENVVAGKPVIFSTSSGEGMRLTSTGLGIGTSSPGAKLAIDSGSTGLSTNFNSTNAAGTYVRFQNSGTSIGDIGGGQSVLGASAGDFAFTSRSGNLVFGTGSTERARIDSSGNLLVGTTSSNVYGSEKLSVNSTGVGISSKVNNASNPTLVLYSNPTSGNNSFAEFFTETSATLRGSITYNRAGGLVAYNVTSDYRAKDISGPVTGSGALIDSIPVYMGKMKGATQERPMFIAHEVPSYAHTGEKDAVDADGNPVYQQMDASALIPVMWAEIQSLRQRLSAANL